MGTPRLVLPLVALGSTASASVISESFATDLIGGILNVTYAVQTGPSNFFVFTEQAAIVAGLGPGSIVAEMSGEHKWKGQTYGWAARLDLAGPTETSPWSLTHTGTDTRVYIMDVFVMTEATLTSGAVFDRGTSPSTIGSGPGTPATITVSGPAVINTNWDPAYLWPSTRNAGDLYTQVLVQWAELNNHTVFGVGTTASWRIDTDTVPAPGCALVLLVLARRRRKQMALCAPDPDLRRASGPASHRIMRP